LFPRSNEAVCQTYDSQRPEEGVVDDHPPLLRKASELLALCDALELAQRREDRLHGAGAQTRKENDAEEDQVRVVDADGVLARRSIVVGEVEELVRD
jgi:hypothetical protein